MVSSKNNNDNSINEKITITYKTALSTENKKNRPAIFRLTKKNSDKIKNKHEKRKAVFKRPVVLQELEWKLHRLNSPLQHHTKKIHGFFPYHLPYK